MIMQPIRLAAAAATLSFVLLAGAPVAVAQELTAPEARQGYYLAAGARSTVSTARDDEVGSLGAGGGGEGVLRVGQMVTPRLGLGVAVGGGAARSSDWDQIGGGLSIEGQLAPVAGLDLAVRAGIGLGVRSLTRRDEMAETDDDPSGIFGSLYTAGVSYDWFVSRRGAGSGGLAVTLAAEARVLAGGDIVDAGMLVGLELTYWGGLRRNQLSLPVAEAFAE